MNNLKILEKKLKSTVYPEKANILLEISENHLQNNPDISIKYGKKLLIYLKNLKNIVLEKDILERTLLVIGEAYLYIKDLKKAENFFNKYNKLKKKDILDAFNNIAAILNKHDRYESALKYFLKIIKINIKTGSKKKTADTLLNIGTIYRNNSNYYNAIDNYKQALDIYNDLKNQNGLASTYNYLGIVYSMISDFETGFKLLLKSINIYEKLNNPTEVKKCYNNIGIIYKTIKEYDKALAAYDKSLKIPPESSDILGTAMTYNNIGIIYTEKGKYNKALYYYDKALKIKEKLGNKRDVVSTYINISVIYLKLNKLKKAENILNKAYKESIESNSQYLISHTLIHLADLNINKGMLKEALKQLKKNIKISKNINHKDNLLRSYKLLSELYFNKKQYKKSFEFFKYYIEIKDEIFNEKSKNKILEIQAKYETEKKEKEAEILRIKNIELAKKNKKIYQMYNKLKKTQEKLIESEKMASLATLVTGIAHEINTPVGIGVSLISNQQEKTSDIIKLLKDDRLMKSNLESYLKTSQQSSELIRNNLQRASNHIKNFKQVAVDQINEEKRIFNLKNYLNEILYSLYNKLKNLNYKISINCDPNLEINNYPGVFYQIISNLLLNSINHAFGENKKGIISIDACKENKFLTINFSDNGIGISKENIKKIFLPFYTTKRGTGGTGLGLNIVYNLVTQKLNGTITCESKLKKGTNFIISIPYSKVNKK